MADNYTSNPTRAMVSGLKLIPQDNLNACWYASTMMMYNWQKSRGGTAANPSDIAQIESLHNSKMPLPWASMLTYAQMVGMRPKPLMSPSVDQLVSWLQLSPLWTDGVYVDWRGNPATTGHVVVLAGVRDVQNSDQFEVFIYDPWPVGTGNQGWRPISHLVGILTAGANPERQVTFLSY